jgi:hypothetical protein
MVATVDRPDWMAKGTSELLGAVSIQPMATASLAGLLATAALRAAEIAGLRDEEYAGRPHDTSQSAYGVRW